VALWGEKRDFILDGKKRDSQATADAKGEGKVIDASALAPLKRMKSESRLLWGEKKKQLPVRGRKKGGREKGEGIEVGGVLPTGLTAGKRGEASTLCCPPRKKEVALIDKGKRGREVALSPRPLVADCGNSGSKSGS